MKLNPQTCQGTEFIRLSSMPVDQVANLVNWLTVADVFTINDFPDCVHYDDYEFWYDNIRTEGIMPYHSLF